MNVTPVEIDSADCYWNSVNNFCSEDLFIGRLKGSTVFQDSLRTQFQDSIFIQVRDVWISQSEIPDLYMSLVDLCPYKARYALYIHLDKSIHDGLLVSIGQLVPDSVSVFKVVSSKDCGLGVVKYR